LSQPTTSFALRRGAVGEGLSLGSHELRGIAGIREMYTVG
jgi:hypothetical protein